MATTVARRPSILRSCGISKLCMTRSWSASIATTATDTLAPSGGAWLTPSTSADISDYEIERLAARPIHQLSLADLVRHGKPPLSEKSLLESANFALALLPIRLAHRVRALRNLPFIIVSNPNISKIYNNYLHSLSTLLPYQTKPIKTLEEEARFTETMADLVQTHANTIPTLAKGFLECRKYISPDHVTRFLDEHLRARIGTRLIAEQHIALHLSSQAHDPDSNMQPPSSYIGVIDTALAPAAVLRQSEHFVADICEYKYGVRPSLRLTGAVDTTVAHIPTHLEYILTELLKNSFRATVEAGREREPIEVTIALGAPPMSDAGAAAAAVDSFEHVAIRIRDRGGGIAPEHLPCIWGYSFTTFKEDEARGGIDALNVLSTANGDGSSIAGLGYGLPLSRAYAEYFGGGIQVQSLWGWGTDVYLHLRGLGGV